jgi:hypothetical protein
MRSRLRCVNRCAATAPPHHVAAVAGAPHLRNRSARVGVVVAVRAARGWHDHPSALSRCESELPVGCDRSPTLTRIPVRTTGMSVLPATLSTTVVLSPSTTTLGAGKTWLHCAPWLKVTVIGASAWGTVSTIAGSATGMVGGGDVVVTGVGSGFGAGGDDTRVTAKPPPTVMMIPVVTAPIHAQNLQPLLFFGFFVWVDAPSVMPGLRPR